MTELRLTWQQTDRPVNTQALLLFAEATLTLADKQSGMFAQQSVLPLQTFSRYLLPQQSHGRVRRTALQAPVQGLALRVHRAHAVGFNTVRRGGRKWKGRCWGRRNTWKSWHRKTSEALWMIKSCGMNSLYSLYVHIWLLLNKTVLWIQMYIMGKPYDII